MKFISGNHSLLASIWLIGLNIFVTSCSIFEKEFIFPLPVAKSAQKITSSSFVAQWGKVNGVSEYEVDLALDESFTQTVDGYQSMRAKENSMSITKLDANVTYYYRVRAKISNQTSQNSNVIEITTLSLNIPTALPATEVTANSLRVHWQAHSSATSYLLDVASDANFNSFLENYQSKDVGLDTNLLINDLKVNEQYFYRIRVKQNNTISEYSNIQSVFTSTLTMPKILPATDIQLTSFTVNWENIPEATSYEVDIATDPLFKDYTTKSVTANSLTITNLKANQLYYSRVRALSNEITSNYSEIIEVRTQNLSAPESLPASNIQIGAFQANWKLVDNASVYLIEVASDQNFNQPVVSYDNIVGTNVLISGLEANVQYYYRVRAQGLSTTSNYSPAISVTTLGLEVPTIQAATNQSIVGFTANWSFSSGATSYLLDVATDAGFSQFLTGYQSKEVTSNSVAISGIDLKQTYYYRVRAKRLSSVSNYSNVTTVDACISQSCKVTKIEIIKQGTSTPTTYSQTFTYDAQNRLSVINENTTDDKKYFIIYNADNSIAQVDLWQGGRLVRKHVYTYTGNQLSIKRFWVSPTGNSGPQGEFVHTYNAQQQLVNRKVYGDHSQANLQFEFKYTYNSKGQVILILNDTNFITRFYNYGDKLSPYALFPRDLAIFISNSTNDAGKGFFPVNNIVSEQIWREQYNYAFTSNSKGIVTEQTGDYVIKYTFAGCSF